MPRCLALELPCVHRAVRVARHQAESFALSGGLADDAVEKLVLVVSELLANAVDHGGGGGALTEAELAGTVAMEMRLVLSDGGWTLEVEDSGGGDPAEALALMTSAHTMDLESERGRGLFLVSEMVDSFDVRVGEGGLIFVAVVGPAPFDED